MANGFGDLKPQQGTAPSSQPGFEELLQQAKMRQAQQFAQGPSEGQKLMDIGEQIAAGYRGGRDFSQVRQLQSQRDLAQDQSLQQFLSHQDNLSMQQQQERRLTLQHMHQKAMDEGNHAAAIMEQITGGNPNDIAELSAWWASELQAAGTDDDNFDPMQVRSAIAEEYTKGINEGRYDGPTEVLSKRDELGITGAQTREQIGARGAQARETAAAQLEHDKALATHEAGLAGGDITKPDNYLLPDGRTVLSYDHKTFTDADTGETGLIPSDAIRLDKSVAATEARTAKISASATKQLETIEKSVQPQTKSMLQSVEQGGIGPWSNLAAGLDAVVGGLGIPSVFGYESGTLFPETAENRRYLRSLKQFGKSALVNNPRFPIAEQKVIDKILPDPDTFWVNPAAEARGLMTLHDTLKEWKYANLAGIAEPGLDAKSKSELMLKNFQIDRMLRFMGKDPNSGELFGTLGDESDDAAFLKQMQEKYPSGP